MKSQNPLRFQHWKAFASLVFSLSLGFWLSLQPPLALAGGVVTNCTEAALRAAMDGGGTVTFACDGTITLASTITNTADTVLDATGHEVTISGGDSVRVFYVQSNVTFSLSHLTIAHGRSTLGAGIFNQNATVNATNTTFYSNVVLGAAGPSMAGGSVAGGAVANSGVINLISCAFTSNLAVGGAGSDSSMFGAAGYGGGSGVGGAIWNSGVVTGNGSTFQGNAVSGGSGGHGGPGLPPQYPGGPGGSGGEGSGATLFNSGVLRLVNCTLVSNTSSGGYGGAGGQGLPFPPYSGWGPNGTPGLGMGAIYNAGGHCYLTNCTAVSNSCIGANLTRGGAIRNDNGEVYLLACVFNANGTAATIFGYWPGASCWGGAVDNSGTLWADLCDFIANSAVGATGLYGTGYGATGGSGGDGKGGALYNSGTISILRTTFTTNSASGGTGGSGGNGYYGDPGLNGGSGGAGGSGGGGQGGAIYNAGSARVVGATFAFNFGSGANAGAGGDGGGSAYGHGGDGGDGGTGGAGIGAFFNSGEAQLINSTFAFNWSSSGNGGAGRGGGSGNFGGNGGHGGNGGSGFGGILDQGSGHLTNCTIAVNWGSGGAAGAGGTAGYGSYQIGNPGTPGSPGSSGGGIIGGQRFNTLIRDNADPLLGPLANNGGPTLTMALLPGSPAIDAGDSTSAPLMDQRGFPRPAGLAPDIGAFEYGSMLPVLSVARPVAGVLNVTVQGNSNQWCRLQASSNLFDWIPLATNQIGPGGTVMFQDSWNPISRQRFYRAVMP